jgi:very-short-patch-repair endonuclease
MRAGHLEFRERNGFRVDARRAELTKLGERQGGAVAHRQLVAAGISDRAIKWLIRRGWLHPIHKGVYAIGRPDLPPKGMWWAAVLACGPGGVLSHRSSAAHDQVLKTAQSIVDVTVSGVSGRSRRGIRIHHAVLTPADVVIDDEGVPRTSLPRTFLDLATCLYPDQLRRALDQAEINGDFDMRAMKELLGRSRGHRGIRKLREALGVGALGEDVTRNHLEARFLAMCRRNGLPLPKVNYWLPIPGEEWQGDFVWPDHRVVVETDGFETHRTRQAFVRDRRRDQVLTVHGWTPVRVSWDDVFMLPAPTALRISSILKARPSR